MLGLKLKLVSNRGYWTLARNKLQDKQVIFFPEQEFQLHRAHLNTKMSSYQNKNSHYKGKMVSQLSYLYNGYPITRKTVFILKQCPVAFQCREMLPKCDKIAILETGALYGNKGP